MTDVAAPPPGKRSVPVWIKDERWEVWHAWPTEQRMDSDGWSLTACLTNWWWTDTTRTSYHVTAAAACPDCNLALQGALKKRRGSRRSLPQGPTPILEPQPLAGMQDVERAKSRTEQLAEQGATVSSYTRPDGKVVTRAHPTRKQSEALDADAELGFTFEVGRRMPAWECIQCGAVLAYGDRYCSTWCSNQYLEAEREARRERFGLVMARRQFEDQLYGRKRRDDFGSWTPPAANIRRPRRAF